MPNWSTPVEQMWPWGVHRPPPRYSDSFVFCPVTTDDLTPTIPFFPRSVSIYLSRADKTTSTRHVHSGKGGDLELGHNPGNRLVVRRLDKERVPKKEKTSIAYCVQPFRKSYDDVAQLVEFIEYHSAVSNVSKFKSRIFDK